MKYNVFGNTGMLVSELCLGTMTFGGQDAGMWSSIGQLQQDEVNGLVKTALDAGINFIDTANVYSYGQSEELLGKSLLELGVKRDEVVIASKVRGRMNEKPNSAGLSRYHIFHSVEQSLQRLQTGYIDVLYVHGVDLLTPVEEIMRSLHELVLGGKVRYIAVCNWPAWMVMKARGIAEARGWNNFVGMQYYYSVAGRDIEREILPLALDQNLALMPWSPLAGGFLSGKYTRGNEAAGDGRRLVFDFPPVNKEKAYDIIDVMAGIAAEHGKTVAEVALAWVRQQTGVTSTIIGAKRPEQLLHNIRSAELELTAGDLQRIAEVSALPAEYPGWMVERQTADRR